MKYRISFLTITMLISVFVCIAQRNSWSLEISEKEQDFIKILLSDPIQQRKELIFDTILHRIARERAIDLAARNYFSHTNPDGIGPNHLLREAGYLLPEHYGKRLDSNNVESLSGGNSTALETYKGWLSSPAGHRKHLLGEIDFWRQQTRFGIGYYYDANSLYKHYWVFISAPAPVKND